MAKLYDITQNYNNLLDLLDNAEIPKDMIDNALNEVGEEFELKAENIAKLIKNFESDVKSFKEEVDKAVKEALKGKVAKKPATPAGLTKEAILAVKDRSERLRLIAENQGLFN